MSNEVGGDLQKTREHISNELKKHGGITKEIAKDFGKLARGVKKGKTIQKELTLEDARKKMSDQIVNASMAVINSALVKATGSYYVYRKHKKFNDYIVHVKDPEEIAEALNQHFNDLEPDEDELTYYVVTAKEPDTKAMQIVLDRAFGKPTETVKNINLDMNNVAQLDYETQKKALIGFINYGKK